MNVVAEIQRINERELALGVGFEASWHQKYKESAWVYVGGLAFELTEGDVLCVMSQFGEIEDINLVRDGKTGKSKGFAFIKYENWLSTVLAVDNMNGATLLERTIRVDHVLQYKLPKEVQDRENERQARLLESSDDEDDDEAKKPHARGLPGHAYEGKELATQFDIAQGQNVFDAPPESEDETNRKTKKHKKKKDKKDKKKKKKSAEDTKTVEQRQAEWMEHVKRQRELRREQEERARALAGDDAAATALPSETGWRGRLEPTERAPPPREGAERGDTSSYDERERKRRAGFGGINRIR